MRKGLQGRRLLDHDAGDCCTNSADRRHLESQLTAGEATEEDEHARRIRMCVANERYVLCVRSQILEAIRTQILRRLTRRPA